MTLMYLYLRTEMNMPDGMFTALYTECKFTHLKLLFVSFDHSYSYVLKSPLKSLKASKALETLYSGTFIFTYF